MESRSSINNLPLPKDLIALINAGRWKCPADLSAVTRLFHEHGTDFTLYTLKTMERENASWLTVKEERWHEPLGAPEQMWLGAPDTENEPGDIVPALSVLIGDLGHGYDQPIALDYRKSMDHPRVLTLLWPEGGPQNNRWIEIAPNILAFAEKIGL